MGIHQWQQCCKKKKVKYDKYFYNDIWPEDSDPSSDSYSQSASESEVKCELGKCTHARTCPRLQKFDLEKLID